MQIQQVPVYKPCVYRTSYNNSWRPNVERKTSTPIPSPSSAWKHLLPHNTKTGVCGSQQQQQQPSSSLVPFPPSRSSYERPAGMSVRWLAGIQEQEPGLPKPMAIPYLLLQTPVPQQQPPPAPRKRKRFRHSIVKRKHTAQDEQTLDDLAEAAESILSLSQSPPKRSKQVPVTTTATTDEAQEELCAVALSLPDNTIDRRVLSARLIQHLRLRAPRLVWEHPNGKNGAPAFFSWNNAVVVHSKVFPKGTKNGDLRFMMDRLPGFAGLIETNHSVILRTEWLVQQQAALKTCLAAFESKLLSVHFTHSLWQLSYGTTVPENEQDQVCKRTLSQWMSLLFGHSFGMSSVAATSLQQALCIFLVYNPLNAVDDNNHAKPKRSPPKNPTPRALLGIDIGEVWPGKPTTAITMTRDLLPLWLTVLTKKGFVKIPPSLLSNFDYTDSDLRPYLAVLSPITLPIAADCILADRARIQAHRIGISEFMGMMGYLRLLMQAKLTILKRGIPHDLSVLINHGFYPEVLRAATEVQRQHHLRMVDRKKVYDTHMRRSRSCKNKHF